MSINGGQAELQEMEHFVTVVFRPNDAIPHKNTYEGALTIWPIVARLVSSALIPAARVAPD